MACKLRYNTTDYFPKEARMKALSEIDLGYGDATNYRNNKRMTQMFNDIFVKDENLERLLREDSFFLIGEKGTGKTAYATFL